MAIRERLHRVVTKEVLQGLPHVIFTIFNSNLSSKTVLTYFPSFLNYVMRMECKDTILGRLQRNVKGLIEKSL